MANIGYRRFNGTTDGAAVNIGNIASASSLDCWILAGRLIQEGTDGEIIATTTYDPLDLYFAHAPSGGTWQLEMYDGASDTAAASTGGQPWRVTDGFVIIAVRRVASTVVRWSKAVYSGSAWGSFTHTNGTVTFTNRTYPSSGILRIAENAALNIDLALIARCTSATDTEINALTTDLTKWSALTGLTNLWRFDGASIVDSKGTATQNTLTGTTVTANGFPLDAGSAGVTGTVAATIAGPTLAATGTFRVSGTVAATIAGPTLAASGTATSNTTTGTVAATIAAPTLAATGVVRVTGTVAATVAGPTLAATGTHTAGSGYFRDDFPSTSIDTGKWTVYNRLGDQVNNEVNAVIPANVRVSGGSLFIDSKFEDVVAGDTTTGAPNPRTVHYSSGQIAQAVAPFLYGDVQVRAKIPGGTGLWPCIWMLGYQWQASQPFTANVAGQAWPTGGWYEIDIAEFMFDHRTQVNTSLHFPSAGAIEERALPFDATTRFMVYRLVWTPTSLTWLVDAEDGVGWRTLRTVTGVAGTDIPNTPGYLIIHTAVGGNGTSAPVSGTFPQTMEVDWAQVVPAGGAAGTIAATIAGPTLAATGTTTLATITGTVARTVAGPTLAASGTHTPYVGTVAATIAGPTLAASGSSTRGTVAATIAGPTLAASGTHTPYVGTVSATLAAPTLAATGTHTAPSVTGTVAATISAPTLAATGTANPPGTAGNIAVTLAPPTLAATGTVGSPATVTGTVSATLAAPTLVATGTHTNSSVTGTIAATLSAPTLAASGTVTAVATTGTVAATIGAPTLTATGFVRVTGSVAATITVTLAAFGSVGSTYDPNPEHVVITQRSRVTIEQRSRYMIGV